MKIRMILIRPFSGEGEDEEVKSASPNNFFGRKLDLLGSRSRVAMETNTINRVFQIQEIAENIYRLRRVAP